MTRELREPAFWILTCLARGRQHGYTIIRDAADLSGGTVSLAVTTLYATLERLEKDGDVKSDGDEVVDGRLRRYFAITESGTARLEAEVERLESKVRAVRAGLGTGRARPLGGTA